MPRLVLDANMLVLLAVGSVDPGLLGIARRVKEYRPADYETMNLYLAYFREIVVLPNTVSEASNLIGQINGGGRRRCIDFLATLVRTGRELYVESGLAVVQPEYAALGVTDAPILCVLDVDTHLLTADFRLYLAATARHQNAKLFADLRS